MNRSGKIGVVLIVVGLTMIGTVVGQIRASDAEAARNQRALRTAYERTTEETVGIALAAPAVAASRTEQARARRDAASSVPRAITPTGPEPIGRLQIPRIGVDTIMVEGVSLSRLAYGPGRYPSSAGFGARGTTAVAGHRTGWGSPFLDLDRLSTGDHIVVETARHRFTYAVTTTRVVRPHDVWVLKGDPHSRATRRLVLTTCTPKYSTRDRLVVWADLVATRAA